MPVMAVKPVRREGRAETSTQAKQLALFRDARNEHGATEVRGNDHAFLRSNDKPTVLASAPSVRVVDLFAGAGGLSLGVWEACAHLGLGFEVAWAADFDKAALRCYSANFPVGHTSSSPIEEDLSLDLEAPLSMRELELRGKIGHIDVLLGGPPCQGHSDLNNSTRRNDPKNSLYLIMARAAEVFRPAHVLIENVVGAQHDKARVVQRTQAHLERLGYRTSLGVVDLSVLGVPQNRKRLILLASTTMQPDVAALESRYRTEERDLAWAIRDLVGRANGKSILDEPSTPSPANRRRMAYLFANDEYDLPNEMRPACHRDKPHTYKSIYGRLSWDERAQTITRGFYSMCMGRYVHPAEQRTLTAHEAARIQFFPDWFDFTPAGTRTALATIIGNAVPMKLSFVAALEMLSNREGSRQCP